ncbi:6940_t:CDS:2, partial [Ambispora gerdemannii]
MSKEFYETMLNDKSLLLTDILYESSSSSSTTDSSNDDNLEILTGIVQTLQIITEYEQKKSTFEWLLKEIIPVLSINNNDGLCDSPNYLKLVTLYDDLQLEKLYNIL